MVSCGGLAIRLGRYAASQRPRPYSQRCDRRIANPPQIANLIANLPHNPLASAHSARSTCFRNAALRSRASPVSSRSGDSAICSQAVSNISAKAEKASALGRHQLNCRPSGVLGMQRLKRRYSSRFPADTRYNPVVCRSPPTASAVFGPPNPCATWHPRLSRRFPCSMVSTPSATA